MIFNMKKQRLAIVVTLLIGLMPTIASAENTLNNFNLMQSIGYLGDMVQAIGIIGGVSLIFSGIFALKRYGEMRTMMSQQMTVAGPLMKLVAGAVLISLPVALSTFLQAFWSTANPVTYHAQSSTDALLIPPVLMFVRLIGVGSFIRGWFLMSRIGPNSQPGTMTKGITHIFAGILLVHILGLYNLITSVLSLN